MKKESRYLEFKDEKGWDYVISFPVKNSEDGQTLRLWVGYERGNRESFYDYQFLHRGFYLYISLEGAWELGRMLTSNEYNRRVFLGGVQRKSKSAYREFAEKAGQNARDIVEKYCKDREIDWDNGTASRWSGCEDALGLWKEEYKITHYW